MALESIDIYSYLDYRSFCRDFYQTQKHLHKEFSFRSFARKASVAASYLKHVIDGKRNLSPEMSQKFGTGMSLAPKEIDYFENLVRFNQAGTIEEKDLYFSKLRQKRAKALRPLGLTEAVNLLSHWYVVAIKELVVNLNSIDVRLIQRVLRKKLSDTLIEKTISHLQEMGWLQQNEGRWVSSVSQIQFPDEVQSYVVRSFHGQMLGLAREALDDDLEEREFGSIIFTFPRSRLPELKEKIKALQKDFVATIQDVAAKAEPLLGDQEVFAFGVQCYSLQKHIDSKEGISHAS